MIPIETIRATRTDYSECVHHAALKLAIDHAIEMLLENIEVKKMKGPMRFNFGFQELSKDPEVREYHVGIALKK